MDNGRNNYSQRDKYKRAESDFENITDYYSPEPLDAHDDGYDGGNNSDEIYNRPRSRFTELRNYLKFSRDSKNEDEYGEFYPPEHEFSEKPDGLNVIFTVCVCILALGIVAFLLIYPHAKYDSSYDTAVKFMESGEYQKAIDTFSRTAGYKDSSRLLTECKYSYATMLMQRGDYTIAQELFLSIYNYSDSKDNYSECIYLQAKEYLAKSDPSSAQEILLKIPNYKDSPTLLRDYYFEKAMELYNSGDFKNASTAFSEIENDSEAQLYTLLCEAQLYNSREMTADIDTLVNLLANLNAYSGEEKEKVLAFDIFTPVKLAGSWRSENGTYSISVSTSEKSIELSIPMKSGEYSFRFNGNLIEYEDGGEWKSCLRVETFSPSGSAQPKTVFIYSFFDGVTYELNRDET